MRGADAVSVGRVAASAIATPSALGQAGIAPVVHVEPVSRHERFEGQFLGIVPPAHHGEAVEQADLFLLGDFRQQRHHVIGGRLRDHPRRELRIDENDVGADRLQPRNAFMQQRAAGIEWAVAQHRIGADLPEHQMRLLGNHPGLETGEHVDRLLAVDAAVEHGELLTGEMLAELDLKSARVGRSRRARTGAIGRRGADGHDLDRLTA